MRLFRRKKKDEFRLDIGRVVKVDGVEFVIQGFHSNSTAGVPMNLTHLSIDFLKYEDWVARYGT